MERISTTHLYIEIAKLISQRGTCGRAQVGAVITQDNRIVATGYNGPLPHENGCNDRNCDLSKSCIRAVHAEANAIYFAAKQGISLKGAALYCTHSPCTDCVEAIVQAGVTRVIFEEKFRDAEPIQRLLVNGIEVFHGVYQMFPD